MANDRDYYTPKVLWWAPNPDNQLDDRDRANALLAETAAIEQRQSTFYETGLWNASLFTNREMVGYRWGAVEAHGELIPRDLRSENLIEEIGEALLSKASSSPLKPTPVPHGKNMRIERAVRKLDAFVSGMWRAAECEEAAVQAFLDAYMSGIGCVRLQWDDDDKCMYAHAEFFDNLVIDNRECGNRQYPRNHRIRRIVPRTMIEDQYGISFSDPNSNHWNSAKDLSEGWMVQVEAWHLPHPGGKYGRHMVAAGGHILVDEEWNHNWVPLLYFHWRDPVSGFLPRSGVELLVPYQIRMNQLNDAIEESQDIAARPRILIHGGTNIDVNQWDNEAGRMLGYTGPEPKPFVWPTNLVELYNERERVRQVAHAYMGLSMMTSQAEMPPQVRLDSSAGVREFRNLEDSRHLRMWTRFEKFRLDIARRALQLIATREDPDAYAPEHFNKATIERIPWKEVKVLSDEEYGWTMDATPLSQLSPAVRRETIRDWSARGLLTPGEERRMEGNPNLEKIEDLELASYDDIYRHLYKMECGEYERPDATTNLTFGIPKVVQNLSRIKDYDDEEFEPGVTKEMVIELHQRWIIDAEAILQSAIPPQPTQMTPFSPTQGMPGTSSAKGPGQ